ncbi:MAG TPA: alpha/beta hydrolase-fold protein [Verrucomicrobiae bacterium]|nr:alpha/beta hydrolase-fold protein [Verrucomicrobiae bacterium]
MRTKYASLSLAAALIFVCWSCSAPPKGTVERIKVHGKSLEGNLEGDSPDRNVSVYLPASYTTEKTRRYPVIYMLHGFTDSDDKWFGFTKHWINLPKVLDNAFRDHGTQEMILVMPNGFTRYQGSMYSNSVTTGNWEEFIVGELVPYIDAHYRTLPQAASRGLAGHSMGGYGTLRIGMQHPDVFSSFYALSACCMALPDDRILTESKKAEAVKDPAQVDQADFMTKAVLASAAAWSPDPQNPPMYLTLPTKDGQLQPAVAAKWHANDPLAMIDQNIANLRQLHGIAFDAGDRDDGITEHARDLDRILTNYHIPHQFAIYEGDHLNHIADRIETKLIPFFSANLSFAPVTPAK